jgi:phenylacetate-CoA ligase
MEGQGQFDVRRALGAMLAHAASHSPYYRDQPWAKTLRETKRIVLREIPITSKSLVRDETSSFYSDFVPPGHGEVKDKPTSGSTGEPMVIRKTDRHWAINAQENVRLKRGWGFGRHQRAVQISVPFDDHPSGSIEESGLPNGRQGWKLYTGETLAAYEFVRRISPTHLTSAPSVAQAILERSRELSQPLDLQLITTITEVVTDELREMVRALPNCRLADVYGCVEAGVIAMQCPRCGAYHPADRHLILEIRTDSGRRARPGEMGRVIVTPLFNRAMPLIRYETGDYAVVAKASGCPRSSFGIERIIGREKNLFKLPGGQRVVPRLPHPVASKLALRKFKLFQTTETDVELHYIPVTDDVQISDEQAQQMVDKYMAPGFRVRSVRVSELPRARSGKYLLHECLI